ncbi:hypothetical protein BH11ARM2_BH11ARM2_11000 [soil metagenome]
MAKPNTHVTPPDRIDRWKKLWGTPRKMDAAATDVAFEEFQDALVPRHMHKLFLKQFGTPKVKFGNRFFVDEVEFLKWETRLETLVGIGEEKLEVAVIYGSPDALEGHVLKGERRRSLRDIVIDDWQAACAIVTAGDRRIYVFVEPKMRGCIVRAVKGEPEEE